MQKQKKYETTLNKGASVIDKLYIVFTWFMVITLCIVILIPLLHVAASSVSDTHAISTGKVFIWPVGFRLTGYQKIIQMSSVWRGYANSIKYVFMSVIIGIILVLLAGYPLSREEFRARGFIVVLLTGTILFSGGIIPLYIVVMKLGLLDSSWSLVLPGAVLPFNVFMMRTYIRSNIPNELYEAANMDGCSHFRYLATVIAPLSKPILAVLVLWMAVAQWNAYFPALMFLSDNKKNPLQLVLVGLLVNFQYDETALEDPLQYATKREMAYLLQYALIIIASLPMLLLYPFIQKYFVTGIMIGSVKG